jgi:hypothetical protein
MSLRCSTCKEVLPEENFVKKVGTKRGFSYKCRNCHNTYCREQWYVKNSEKQKASGKAWKEKQRIKVYEYLLEHPCECGESDPVVLEFDHDDKTEKSYTISKMIGKISNETLMKEIEKCTVRCANCHRRRTAEQFGWYNFINRSVV